MAITMLMRAYFAQLLHQAMADNPRIWILTGDLGYKMWDQIRADFPERYLNVGAAEQNMVGVATGLALQGQIPFVYSITPFLLYRPFETIRNYLEHEKIPVKLIGAGRDKEYGANGFSHWATEDKKVLALFPHISAHWPTFNEELAKILQRTLTQSKPFYINLKR